MNALCLVLEAIVLFLFALRTLSSIGMVKGCFLLRRLARGTPRRQHPPEVSLGLARFSGLCHPRRLRGVS
jgi:hypothetical protein